jgi:hypothetical protein
MNYNQQIINELDIKDELTCFKCNNIIKNPLQCLNCQNIFCKKCNFNNNKKCCEYPIIKKCKFLKNFLENLYKIKISKKITENSNIFIYDDLIKQLKTKITEQNQENSKLLQIKSDSISNKNFLESKINFINQFKDINKQEIKKNLKELTESNKILKKKLEYLNNENKNYLYNF